MSSNKERRNLKIYPYRQKRKIRKTGEQTRTISKYYLDFYRSKRNNIDTDNIRSVCIMLGPYRNLTTLTAGIVFLHPNCQVLNHAALRVLPVKPVNFFQNHSQATFDNFIQYAIYLSQSGRREDWDLGGTLTVSHAFVELMSCSKPLPTGMVRI